MLILMPLMLLATVYGVWMSLRYSLAVPSCVVEDLTARQSIRRSISLSEGSRGRIFVLGLLVSAVRMMLGLLFSFPIIFFAVKHLGQPLPIGWMVFQQLGVFFSNMLIGPIYAIGLTLFYYDQRIRKEGYDIEWMMQAAGLLPQQAAGEPAANLIN
jgi:membrane-anchored glycerophosphoryl diester phosphodiesterase (GDPDase)